MNIDPAIIRSLEEQGINTPTPIQEKAIPLIKAGKDVVGISKTGSGKTIAFGAPLLEHIQPGKGFQALIMAPIRELAVQISDELQKLSKYKRCSIATVYGGVSLNPQIDAIAQADIVVGTPGRLRDHLERRNLDVGSVNCVILDEADKMVEMGFIEDISRIIDYMPEHKQMLLFGATISTEIEKLKRQYMHSPEVAEAESFVKEDLLEQFYYNIEPRDKFSLLVHLVKKVPTGKTIIFCSARSTVELVAKNLRREGISSEMMHGKLSQNHRLQVIDAFHKNKVDVLVASSVAARGLDIKDVTHIFNYDLSPDPQEYIHRIGRTARAGESGKAITLLCHRDYEAFDQILRRYHCPVQELKEEDYPRLRFETQSRESRFGDRQGGRQGGRSFDRGNREGNRSGGNFRGSRNYGDSSSYPRDRSRSLTRDNPSSMQQRWRK